RQGQWLHDQHSMNQLIMIALIVILNGVELLRRQEDAGAFWPYGSAHRSSPPVNVRRVLSRKRRSRQRAPLPVGSRRYTHCPAFITASTFCKHARSSRALPLTTTRSARLPGVSVPR